jgi:AcrR family transcriptional regulator
MTALARNARLTRRRNYHHGHLKEALVDAASALLAEQGPDSVTVRQAAKRAGVSSGAPFRHFPSRTALMTAVAEEASDDPVRRFRAIGAAFLRWAVRNPMHFQVISSRPLIDFEGSGLRRQNDEIRAEMVQFIAQAEGQGRLKGADAGLFVFAARALAYGVARMYVDGQFPS